ncbi:MAG: hypothetical protein ACYS8W_14520 [Planctomycetota bacterium]
MKVLLRLCVCTILLLTAGCASREQLKVNCPESKPESSVDDVITIRQTVEKLLQQGAGGRAALTHKIEKCLDNGDVKTPKKFMEILLEPQTADANIRKYFIEKLLAHGLGGKSIVENLVIGKDRTWLVEFLGSVAGGVWTEVDVSAPPSKTPPRYSDLKPKLYDYGNFNIRTDGNGKVVSVSYEVLAEFRAKDKSSGAKKPQPDSGK